MVYLTRVVVGRHGIFDWSGRLLAGDELLTIRGQSSTHVFLDERRKVYN